MVFEVSIAESQGYIPMLGMIEPLSFREAATVSED